MGEAQRRWRAKNPDYGRRWRAANPEKVRAYERRHAEKAKPTRKAWEAANKAKRRDYHLRRRFGMEPGTYDRMLAAQNGVCGICEGPPIGRAWLDVDHCHKTGRIRGLLCNPCNRQLGFIEKYFENPERFDRWVRR